MQQEKIDAGIQVLNDTQVEQVSGAMNDWTAGGIAVLGLGATGGPVTMAFGLPIGLSMLAVGYFAQ